MNTRYIEMKYFQWACIQLLRGQGWWGEGKSVDLHLKNVFAGEVKSQRLLHNEESVWIVK